MPLHRLPIGEIRDYCKRDIESLEYWLRRLIDEVLSDAYGSNYLYAKDKDGNNIINSPLRGRIQSLYDNEPGRFSRLIDAALLDYCIDIVCNPVLFKEHFREAFKSAFPDGDSRNETRTFLKRLVKPRNQLYHANPISVRQAEQVICYTHDIIESLKNYYTKLNKASNYNVPIIIKITDSLGNEIHSTQINRNATGRGCCILTKDEKNFLRPGDTLQLGVEVDSSFPVDSYDIEWVCSYPGYDIIDNDRNLVLPIDEKCVREDFTIYCKVTSHEGWHRCGDCDDCVSLVYKVLPPI